MFWERLREREWVNEWMSEWMKTYSDYWCIFFPKHNELSVMMYPWTCLSEFMCHIYRYILFSFSSVQCFWLFLWSLFFLLFHWSLFIQLHGFLSYYLHHHPLLLYHWAPRPPLPWNNLIPPSHRVHYFCPSLVNRKVFILLKTTPSEGVAIASLLVC